MENELVESVEREVVGWPGVGEERGRFGSTVYRFGRRELGHVHRDGIFDLPVGRASAKLVLAEGRARPHRAGLEGYVSHPVRDAEDLEAVIAVLRSNYERAREAAARRAKAAGEEATR